MMADAHADHRGDAAVAPMPRPGAAADVIERAACLPRRRFVRLLAREFIAAGGLLSTALPPSWAASAEAAGARRAPTPWPSLPAPPRGRFEQIADDLDFNGLPMRLQRFDSAADATEVAAFYEAHWRRGYAQTPHRIRLPDGIVVSQLHGPYLMTVTVRPRSPRGSDGLLVVTSYPLEQRPPTPSGTARGLSDQIAFDLPQLPDARVVSVLASRDPGRHARHWVLVTPRAVATVRAFYRNAFLQQGWILQHEADGAPGAGVGVAAGWQAAFHRIDREAAHVATPLAPVDAAAVIAGVTGAERSAAQSALNTIAPWRDGALITAHMIDYRRL